MAVVFELSAHFGSDETAARHFMDRIIERYHLLVVGNHVIELHAPLLSSFRDSMAAVCFDVSIIPVAVGFGVGLDHDRPHLRLTSEELTEVGSYLYRLLQGLNGYQVAMVGWDVDRFDLAELQTEYQEEIMDGSMHGLVVAHGLRHTLPPSPYFIAFDEQHDWLPYQGTKAGM